jgi:hypothetical protein
MYSAFGKSPIVYPKEAKPGHWVGMEEKRDLVSIPFLSRKSTNAALVKVAHS